MANIILRTTAGRFGTLAGGLVIAAAVWVGFGGSMGAAPRVPDALTCLPTCNVDGRSFVVAGNDPTTLSAQAITIGLNYTVGEPVVNFAIFDADHLTNWDTPFVCVCPDNGAPGPELVLSLYRDPAADGTGVVPANLVASWTPGAVPGGLEQGPYTATNNAWSADTVAHDPLAVGLDGDFHYALVIGPFNPVTNLGWNAFKIRAEGTVTLLQNQIVAFIGAMNPSFDLGTIYPSGFPNQTGTPYDGQWVFNTILPANLGDVTVFDGDMDFGNAACAYNDTDDPDSDPANPNSAFFPTGIPPFAIGSAAAAEGVAVATGGLLCGGVGPGVRTGSPAEDGAAAGAFTRVPSIVPAGIAYQVRAPDGQVFLNQNPSGNKEWEQFKIQKVNNAADIPGGIACPPTGFAESPGFTLPDNPADNLYPASDCRTLVLPGGNWQIELDGMDLANLNFWFFSFKVEPPDEGETRFIVIDEDSIDNGIGPNDFSATDVNDQIAKLGQRRVLPRFDGAFIGTEVILFTGQTMDEGWFSVPTIPQSWADAGPNFADGLRNFVGLPVGPGLGKGKNPEKLLDKIPDVTPWTAPMLFASVGDTFCAVVYDSDISVNYNPLNGSLKGANLGIVAFQVLEVRNRGSASSSSLPKVNILILDANQVCAGPLNNQLPPVPDAGRLR